MSLNKKKKEGKKNSQGRKTTHMSTKQHLECIHKVRVRYRHTLHLEPFTGYRYGTSTHNITAETMGKQTHIARHCGELEPSLRHHHTSARSGTCPLRPPDPCTRPSDSSVSPRCQTPCTGRTTCRNLDNDATPFPTSVARPHEHERNAHCSTSNRNEWQSGHTCTHLAVAMLNRL